MQKMSKAEAGKKGAEQSRVTAQKKKEERIEKYMLSPTVCKQCSAVIGYDKRTNKFCSSSCSASFNNSLRESKIVEWHCLNCDKPHRSPTHKIGSYCDNKCQHEHAYKNRVEHWKAGGEVGKSVLKRYLAAKQIGCWECGIVEWNGKPLVLELEHIDGNAENNVESNLSLLCPNCHSQTDTYKGKNIGNGRHYRRARYHNKQSY